MRTTRRWLTEMAEKAENTQIKQAGFEAFEAFERLDEDAIRQELAGVWAKDLVYQFTDKGRTVTGLSIRGVEEAARFMVRHGYNIAVDKATMTEENDKEFRAACQVTFTTQKGTKMTTWGYSRQSKIYDGGRPNEFAYIQALSKAQRNALRTVIPEKLMAELIDRFQKGPGYGPERVRVVNPAQKSTQAPVTPTQTPAAEATPLPSTGVFLQVLRFILPVDKFVGSDMKEYGPFKVEDVGNVPQANAETLIKRGVAQAITDEAPPTTEPAKTDVVEWGEMKKEGRVYGTVNLKKDGSIEIFFDPFLDRKLQGVDSTFTSFIENRVLAAMKKKAENEKKLFEWNIEEDENWIHGATIIGDLTGETVKELLSPFAWIAKVAADKASQVATGASG